ncbi:flagellar basal body rod protein FlgB [bacterium]|nr:flagellar basal body rod protein FlgB [bacterium]
MLDKLLIKNTIAPVLKKSLDAYSLRHKAIASNLANVEVKGFKRREVKFEDELKDALFDRGRGLCRTHSRHMPIRKGIEDVNPDAVIDASNPKYNAINNVDVDMEMADMAKNQLNFNTMATVLRMEYQRLRMAIRGT